MLSQPQTDNSTLYSAMVMDRIVFRDQTDQDVLCPWGHIVLTVALFTGFL